MSEEQKRAFRVCIVSPNDLRADQKALRVTTVGGSTDKLRPLHGATCDLFLNSSTTPVTGTISITGPYDTNLWRLRVSYGDTKSFVYSSSCLYASVMPSSIIYLANDVDHCYITNFS